MEKRGLIIVGALSLLNALAAYLLDSDRFQAGFELLHPELILTFLLVPVLGWALWQPFRLMNSRHESPLGELARIYKSHAPRLAVISFVMVLYLLSANALAVFKVNIPHLIPFYADAGFAALDRAIFQIDPWRLTHSLGEWFTLFCDRIYVTWFVGVYGSVVVLAFAKDARKQFIGLMAFTLIWLILGQVCATLLSSAGPILVGDTIGDRQFDPLLAKLGETPGLFVLMAREKLLSMDSGLGAGISAMPSLHVAMAIYWALLARLYVPRWWALPAVYGFLIWLASVHLGWHYAVDGLVSLVGVLIIWRVVERLADVVFAEPRPSAALA